MKNIYLLPKTNLGKWSVGLIVAMFGLFAIGSFAVGFYENDASGETILADVVSRPGIALPMLAGFAVGISAFISGITSIFRDKERAVFVFFTTVLGAFLVFLLIGEIVSPH